MDYAAPIGRDRKEQDQSLADAFNQEARRLRTFIRKRVPDEFDAEDVLQDVFFELLEAYRLMKPVAHTGGWLFQVARNKITDVFRKKRPEILDDGERLLTAEVLPSPGDGPDAAYVRRVILDEIDAALDELPANQREVFVAHEVEGRSFREIAEETGASVSTLQSRKHYAVNFLRRRLRELKP